MLVLSRKTQQQIQIGDNVRITILQVKGNSVRIGIEAPREVRVLRCELSAYAPRDVTALVSPLTASVGNGRIVEARSPADMNAGFSSPVDAPSVEATRHPEPFAMSHDQPFIAAHAALDEPSWPRHEPTSLRSLAARYRAVEVS